MVDVAFVEDQDAVAHGHGFDLVVGDVDGGGADAAVEALELFAGRGAELSVEIGKRLVEKEDGGLADDGAGQGDALAFTTGKFARLAVEKRADAEEAGGSFHFFLVLIFGDFLGFEGESDVFVDREMRVERIALKDHGDAAVTRRKIVDDLSADEDFAGGRIFEAGDHAEESGFAGAGGAEENEKLAFASFEGDIVYGTEMTFFEDFG